MANVIIVIADSDIPAARKATCRWAGLPESNENAKAAVAKWVKNLIALEKEEEQRLAAPSIPPANVT